MTGLFPARLFSFPANAAFLLLLLFAGFFVLRSFSGSGSAGREASGPMGQSQAASPPLEYTVPECINSSLWLAVFNSGIADVSNISVFSGDKVYAGIASLAPGSSHVFSLGSCASVDPSGLMVGYCAMGCVSAPLSPKGGSGAAACVQNSS